MRKIHLRHIVSLILTIYSFSFCKVAFYSEVSTLTALELFNASTLSNSILEPPVLIGARISPTKTLGIDIGLGFIYSSGNNRDAASSTQEQPAGKSIVIDLGIYRMLFKGEKSKIGLLGKLGINSMDRFATAYDPSKPYPEKEKYKEYPSMTPSLFIGIEPSYSLSENFYFFTIFGVRTYFYPNSKYIDTTDPTYNFNEDIFPLKDKKDKKTVIGTDGLTIGFGYAF